MPAPHGLWPPRNFLCALDVTQHILRVEFGGLDPFKILDSQVRTRPIHDIARDYGHRTDTWLCRRVCDGHNSLDWSHP